MTTTARDTGAVNTRTADTNWTTRFLASGLVAGPLFVGVSLIQAFTREGFDPRRHAISMLSLGDLGWIQVTNFLASGLLTVLFAIAVWTTLRGGRAGTAGPLLVGIFGAGTFAAGLFSTDPAMSFPPGAPAGLPETLSWHAILHGVAFFVAFASLVAACFVFARRFAHLRRWRWTGYSGLSGVAAPALVALGVANPSQAGVPFLLAATVAFAWLTGLAIELLVETRGAKPDARDRGRPADVESGPPGSTSK